VSSSLTTDQSTYQVGQPVRFTFTETNTSDQPVTVSSFDGEDLTVSQDGVVVWRPFEVFYFCAVVKVLQPGETYTTTSTWDGIPNAVPPSILSGSFTVTSEGARASFQIASPPAAQLATRVTTDQSTYQ